MTIPAATRRSLRQRSEGVCEKCGLRSATNAHHRKNRYQGGLDTLANLLHLCGSGTTECHGWITEHPAESYLKGWSLRRNENPTTYPVLYRGSLVTLDDLGGVEDFPGAGMVTA